MRFSEILLLSSNTFTPMAKGSVILIGSQENLTTLLSKSLIISFPPIPARAVLLKELHQSLVWLFLEEPAKLQGHHRVWPILSPFYWNVWGHHPITKGTRREHIYIYSWNIRPLGTNANNASSTMIGDSSYCAVLYFCHNQEVDQYFAMV